jgi:hypothetical protein
MTEQGFYHVGTGAQRRGEVLFPCKSRFLSDNLNLRRRNDAQLNAIDPRFQNFDLHAFAHQQAFAGAAPHD